MMKVETETTRKPRELQCTSDGKLLVSGGTGSGALATLANQSTILANQTTMDGKLDRILEEDYKVSFSGNEILSPGSLGHFEINIIDSDDGPVASANLTAGTYVVVRVRAGVETTIVTATACSKTNGKIYIDYTFLGASFQLEDNFKVTFAGQSCVIDGQTKYIESHVFTGVIQDITTLSGKVDTIVSNTNATVSETDASALDSGQGTVTNKSPLDKLMRWAADILNDGTNGLAAIKTAITSIATSITKVWNPEQKQALSAACTANNTWVTVFTYDSVVYNALGGMVLYFPATETYEVRITTIKGGAAGQYADPVRTVDATLAEQTRNYEIPKSEYVLVEARRTANVGAQTITGFRYLDYAKNSGAAAPTV